MGSLTMQQVELEQAVDSPGGGTGLSLPGLGIIGSSLVAIVYGAAKALEGWRDRKLDDAGRNAAIGEHGLSSTITETARGTVDLVYRELERINAALDTTREDLEIERRQRQKLSDDVTGAQLRIEHLTRQLEQRDVELAAAKANMGRMQDRIAVLEQALRDTGAAVPAWNPGPE